MEEAITKAEAQELRTKLGDLKNDIAEMARLAKDKVIGGTAEWTKTHPLAALGVAAGLGASLGFAIGLLVGRNRG